MTIGEHIKTFAGRKVREFPPPKQVKDDPATIAWRIEDPDFEGGDIFLERLEELTNQPWADRVTALVIGEWGSAYDSPPPMDSLVQAIAKLPSLEAIFLAEMTFEECEISWINHTDITALFEACPRLTTLTVRGAEGLSLKSLRHESLRSLTFQSGGLPADVVRTVGECEFPHLEHLELWLGTDNYGGDATPEDLAQILAGGRLPALKALGLRDSEIADMVAAALANAPVVARLEVLDLSLGMLSDAGATALLTGQPLTHLRKLDLHHHYLSEPVMDRIRAELVDAGVEVDLGDAGDPDNVEDRYVAVAE
ncbi:MAG TPA: STM4015 family protein [Candidatus Limnocylindrales bacterium]|nr:STM4015 family protein [Candidatus Limnocylindrales bacterium]